MWELASGGGLFRLSKDRSHSSQASAEEQGEALLLGSGPQGLVSF